MSGTETDMELRNAKQLMEASINPGFVFVRNLGNDIPVKDIDFMFRLSRTFFASDIEEKQKCAISEDNHGWVPMHSETLDAKRQRIGDYKEAFNIGEFDQDHKFKQPLPSTLSAHEITISRFFTQCHAFCLKLLTLFGLGLDIHPKTYFQDRHLPLLGPSGTTLRLLYYPAITPSPDYDPQIDIRAGAHSDYGSITLLFQRPSQPGLEILHPSSTIEDPVWCPVPVYPPGTEHDPSPPILVNIGDLFSYWTKGLFRSTVHRVVSPAEARKGGEDRYSIAFFCHPRDDCVLEPVPSEAIQARPEVGDGRVITAKEHLMRRLKATYLSLYGGENWDM